MTSQYPNRAKKGSALLILALPIILTACFWSFPSSAAMKYDSGLGTTAKVAGFRTGTNATTALNKGIAQLINEVLGYVGVLFLFVMIYAGVLWMTAQGNEEKIGKAKKLMTGAVIGAVLVFGAYSISSFIIRNVGTAVEQTSTTRGN